MTKLRKCNIKIIFWLIVAGAFIWIALTDDVRVRLTIRSENESVTAEYLGQVVADCIVSELGAAGVEMEHIEESSLAR